MIEFNVGGQKISISTEALESHPDSLFAMTANNTKFKSVKDESGAICIDRDCKVIQQVVRYMETGELPKTSLFQGLMLEDARYFGLCHLVERLEKVLATPKVSPTSWPRTDGMYMVYKSLMDSEWAYRIAFQTNNRVTVFRAGHTCKTEGTITEFHGSELLQPLTR
jgi:hypothetical protein